MIFKSKPHKIKAVKFQGTEPVELKGCGKVCGTKLPLNERVLKFWNKLHDSELEAEVGDWVVYHDKNDLYPIKEEVLFSKYERVSNCEEIADNEEGQLC